MSSKFLNLDEDKQNSIINASLAEFSRNGFDRASTNEIVLNAGISKGALYHYFGSKKNLFIFLCNFVMDIICKEYYEKIDFSNGDIIERLKQAGLLKMQLYKSHPKLFDFVKIINNEKSNEVLNQVQETVERITTIGYGKLLNGINYSLFKEGISVNIMKDIIMWVIEGYGYRSLEDIKDKELYEIDLDKIITEFDGYLNVLRSLFYR